MNIIRLLRRRGESTKGQERDKPLAAIRLLSLKRWGIGSGQDVDSRAPKHRDIPNACVKAKKEADLEIFLELPRGMNLSDDTMKRLKATSVSELALQ